LENVKRISFWAVEERGGLISTTFASLLLVEDANITSFSVV